LVNPSADVLVTLVPADVVVVSRPDVYDPHGVLAGYLAGTIIKKPGCCLRLRIGKSRPPVQDN
jgi:hypothetical protein